MLFIMNASVIYVSEYHYIYVICCGVRGIKKGLHVYNVMFVNVLLYLPLFYAISQCTNNKKQLRCDLSFSRQCIFILRFDLFSGKMGKCDGIFQIAYFREDHAPADSLI